MSLATISFSPLTCFHPTDGKVPKILQLRLNFLVQYIFTSMKTLNIPVNTIDKVAIHVDFTKISINPNVKKKGNILDLEIPALFLIESKDMQGNSSMANWIHAFLKQSKNLSKKELLLLCAFKEAINDPYLANEAKKFIIFHELAHIYLNDFRTLSLRKSREREKKADLISAEYSQAVLGGIYLFKIMSKYTNEPAKTHPTFSERVNYLQIFQIIMRLRCPRYTLPMSSSNGNWNLVKNHH